MRSCCGRLRHQVVVVIAVATAGRVQWWSPSLVAFVDPAQHGSAFTVAGGRVTWLENEVSAQMLQVDGTYLAHILFPSLWLVRTRQCVISVHAYVRGVWQWMMVASNGVVVGWAKDEDKILSYNPNDLLDRGGKRNPFQNRLSVNDPERDELGSGGISKTSHLP